MLPSALPRRHSLFDRYQYAVLMAVMLIASCANKDPKPLANNTLVFETSGQIINRGSPLKITVVQLSSKSRFMAEEYFTLQSDVDKALDDQLLGKDELFISPDEDKKIMILDPAADARYLGIFAEYKQMEDKAWRLLLPVPPAKASSVWSALWSSADPDMFWTIQVTPSGFQRPSSQDGHGEQSSRAEQQGRRS